MAPLESQQGSDAEFEEGGWDDLLTPYPVESDLAVGGVATHRDAAVGDDADAADVGVQASPSLPLWALEKIRGFSGLSQPVDKNTVQELLALLPALPAPDGPKLLLDEIRLRNPELFERLYESMRRTKQRTEAA
ncbi:unnamed protein product [Cladocopium goreaui]|uniref:Uncharacterized protein n=1 Tax=Cladocopium goreaui TaxID=2562237 RepID=A0A9P1GDJ6_9DINO|nr:unnamed protein product [Cladocopium goreaui]